MTGGGWLEDLLSCVHCGFCLPVCPTYEVLGEENDSPRGRIYLMRALAEGRIGVEDAFAHHVDRCTTLLSIVNIPKDKSKNIKNSKKYQIIIP